MTAAMAPGTVSASHWKRYRVLYALLAVCIAPVIASYLAYYVLPPSGRTNYGTLMEPRPVSATPLTLLDGRPFNFSTLAGRWVMLTAAPAACASPCTAALLQMRQQRLMTGKDRERVERVWLVTDEATISPELLREYEGTIVVRTSASEARDFLAPDGGSVAGHVWLIDPMGNLMLRWPQDPEPQRVKNDLARLLTASSHWVRIDRAD